MNQTPANSMTGSPNRFETVNVDACYAAGLQALERGDLQEAVAWAARCGTFPEAAADARYAVLQGRIAAAAGNFAEVAAHFRMAIQGDPHETAFARQLVEILKTEGQLDEAVGVLEKLSQKDPQQADVFVDLGE
jgi:tetratricopeptide (TPR) repeat protein